MKRRESLKLINSFILSLSLPSIQNWITGGPQGDIIAFAKSKNIKFLVEGQVLSRYARDYANIYQSIPRAVLLPDSNEQLKSILSLAN